MCCLWCIALVILRNNDLYSNSPSRVNVRIRKMTIETTHLQLVPFSPVDLLALIDGEAAFGERFTMPAATGLRAFVVSDDVSPTWVEQLYASTVSDPWVYGFGVVHSLSRLVIGTAGFKGAPGQDRSVEIAYGIVPAFEGRGYATEAALALVTFAFADDRVDLVSAHTLPARNASTRVLEKCGFRQVGDVVDPEDGVVWRWELRRPAPI